MTCEEQTKGMPKGSVGVMGATCEVSDVPCTGDLPSRLDDEPCEVSLASGEGSAGGPGGAHLTGSPDGRPCESDAGASRESSAPAGGPRVELRKDAEGLALVGDGMVLRADLTRMLPRIRADRLGRELLVRAARIKGAAAPTAIDATAGLGEDGLLLAAAGFTVRLFERDPVIAALLRDALRRAAEVPGLARAVGRMELAEGDSVAELERIARDEAPAPDVVYLDPMFPERTKSAAVKKKFQLLHHLERPCDDEEGLLRAALAAHPRKVVVKRPVKGPHLASVRPAYALAGKAVRYDVLVPAR